MGETSFEVTQTARKTATDRFWSNTIREDLKFSQPYRHFAIQDTYLMDLTQVPATIFVLSYKTYHP
jgi:hypothetical protein